MQRDSVLRAGARLAVITAALAVGCGEGASLTSPPSFAQLHQIANSWWPKEEAAFSSANPSSLQALFTGQALEVAQGQMTMARLKGTSPKYPRPLRGSVIFALAAPPAPTWFLAIIQYAPIDQDGRELPSTRSAPGMIFTLSAGTWKVSVADVQAPIPHPTFGSDAVLSPVGNDSRYILPAAAVPPAYTSFLNDLSANRHGVAPFATGSDTFSWQFARIEWPPSPQAAARFSFTIDVSNTAAYTISNAANGATPEILLFVVRRNVILSPHSGCLVRRSDDLSWSDIVPAGSYRSLTLTSISVVAASVPVNDGDSSQGREVIDVSGGIDDVAANVANC